MRRLLALVRRASARVRAALVLGLLVAAYVLVVPWVALLRGRRGYRGLRRREDPGVGSLERLRKAS